MSHAFSPGLGPGMLIIQKPYFFNRLFYFVSENAYKSKIPFPGMLQIQTPYFINQFCYFVS